MSLRALPTARVRVWWVVAPAVAAGIAVGYFPLPVFAAFAVVVVTAVVLTRPVLGIAALVLLMPFSDLISQRLGEGTAGLAFGAIKDILLVLVLVGGLMTGRLARFPKWIVGVLLFIQMFATIAGFLTGDIAQAAYGWRVDFEPMLLVVATPLVLTRVTATRITTMIAATAQVAGVITIATWRLGMSWLETLRIWPPAPTDRFPVSYFSHENFTPRAFSPYFAPNEMAAAAAVTVAVICSREDWSPRRRMLLCILPIIAIILSRSRSGQLGLLLVLLVVAGRFLRKRHLGATPTLVAVAGLFGAAGVFWKFAPTAEAVLDPSLGAHSISLQVGTRLLAEYPFGYGLGRVGPRAFRYTEEPILMESHLLVIGLEAGIIVLALYLFLQVRIAGMLARDGSAMAFMGFAALVAVTVSQIVLPSMQDSALSFLVWIVVGIGITGFMDRSHDPPLEQRV